MNNDSVWDPDKRQKMPKIEDILKARDLLSETIRKTPLQSTRTFSGLAGTNLFMKLECLQVTGSFKVRGAFAKVSRLSDKQAGYGVIAASAGNHAQGVAYAAAIKKIPCTIVMPQNASPAKVAATRSYGAQVVRRGANYDEAWEATQEIARTEGRTIIHAFDDPDIIAGQGTIGLEILEDLQDVDRIYLPVGGGGLAAGVAIAVKSKKPNVKIIGVESKAFPAMKESVAKGSLQSTKRGYSIADGIAVKQPGKLTYEIVSKYVDDIVLVDDVSIVKTMFLLMERAKLVVEPAGAASLAYLISNGGHAGGRKDKVVTVLSGGNVDMYLLGQVVAKGLMQMGRMLKIFILLPDKPGALKGVVDSIAELSINIVEVEHDRLSSHIPAGTAGVYLSLEMEDEKHAQRLVEFLKQKEIEFKVVS
ncbi:threonine ammonia-lyase [Candidatus Nitrososphaera gargensis Ga9.2]|uniref:threonine ammonia-lyase n=1 Tax=Nitrososphaera gargensis (strain Ga9.2) TaxID=1237085 RepID=K0ID68_NITGG|nr:threonine ammonia-lyase [Candidatus Nitrososphaera gargensis]AFU59331.1 threonine ammonia-lyase [Candidatus Nitrososphaera gargensis Ga9.2]